MAKNELTQMNLIKTSVEIWVFFFGNFKIKDPTIHLLPELTLAL